jgi:Mrp family chromosome partitioning ATPase
VTPGRRPGPAVITVGPSESGVAKTTTAVNLGAALGERGRECCRRRRPPGERNTERGRGAAS